VQWSAVECSGMERFSENANCELVFKVRRSF
jgi:hypothetical protein